MSNQIRNIVSNLVSKGIEMPALMDYLNQVDPDAVWLGYMDAESREDIL